MVDKKDDVRRRARLEAMARLVGHRGVMESMTADDWRRFAEADIGPPVEIGKTK